MATIISTKTSGVGGLEVTGDATGILQLASNNGTTAVTIDASQNVSIAGTTTISKGTTGTLAVQSSGTSGTYPSTGAGFEFVAGSASGQDSLLTYNRTSSAWRDLYIQSNNMLFGTNGTERMRIDSSGNVLVGATSEPSASISGVKIVSPIVAYSRFSAGNNNGDIWHIGFLNGNGLVGRIATNGTATSYVTSSDYRLKENVQPMIGALDTVAKLNPVTFTWKTDGSDGQGFIAHELQAIVPDCVSGEKDAIDAEGNPVYQGIDTSFLVATLTAAIQELKAIIDTQAERIAVLESKV